MSDTNSQLNSSPQSTPAPDAEPFFVGYLDVPPALRRFLRAAAVAAALLVTAVAVAVGAFQRDPGRGRWEYGQRTTLAGTFTADPYPSLVLADGERLLLVGEGKVTAPGDADDLAGRRIDATGSLIGRDGQRMLELPEPPVVAERSGAAVDIEPAAAPLGRLTLRGEIIDPKCYLGAMKPGDGKPHKGCAALCLRGGIPPMLRTLDPGSGDAKLYLLVRPDGGAFSGRGLEDLIAVVGEPVEVTGDAHSRGGQLVLAVSPADVRRR